MSEPYNTSETECDVKSCKVDESVKHTHTTLDQRDAENYVEEMDYINDENRRCAGFGFLAGRAGMVPAAEVERRVAEAIRSERERCAKLMSNVSVYLPEECLDILTPEQGGEEK